MADNPLQKAAKIRMKNSGDNTPKPYDPKNAGKPGVRYYPPEADKYAKSYNAPANIATTMPRYQNVKKDINAGRAKGFSNVVSRAQKGENVKEMRPTKGNY